jgi:hypothetical protein
VISEDQPHETLPYGVSWHFQLKPGEKVRTRFTIDEGHS